MHHRQGSARPEERDGDLEPRPLRALSRSRQAAMPRLSAQQAILVRRTALGLAHRRQGETVIRALARIFLAIIGAETDDAARRSAELLSEIAPELLRRAQRALADATVHYVWQRGWAQRYYHPKNVHAGLCTSLCVLGKNVMMP